MIHTGDCIDVMAGMEPESVTTCTAYVYRGEWRSEMCGKPAKGERTMFRSEVTKRPACGIHMRARNAMWWGDK